MVEILDSMMVVWKVVQLADWWAQWLVWQTDYELVDTKVDTLVDVLAYNWEELLGSMMVGWKVVQLAGVLAEWLVCPTD